MKKGSNFLLMILIILTPFCLENMTASAGRADPSFEVDV